MKPPYEITPAILALVASISELIGEVNANFLNKPSPTLRKQNQIKTIHSSLQIEGNTLTQDQITALLENKRISGPAKDIAEVLNAATVYGNLDRWHPFSEKDFRTAHQMMMNGLIENAGKYRTKPVGIVQGSQVAHVAPPAEIVPSLMKDLFKYLKSDEIHLVKSCVFHYELEFIHPFTDGNGRMGRLWQTVVLLDKYPVFGFLPFETLISQDQQAYYQVLAACDKAGKSTLFIEYMLKIIESSLGNLLSVTNRVMKDTDRIAYFLGTAKNRFTRKDYMHVFKDISTATASRDLKKAVELGLVSKEGEKNKAVYVKK